MTTNTATPDTASTDAEVYTFESGSWQHTLQLSAQAEDKSAKAKALAGRRLWTGTVKAVQFFTDVDNDTITTDPSGETLASLIKPTGLSASAISKIKNVALAARDREDFDFDALATEDKMSLDKADKRVRALAKADEQPAIEAAEDDAADEAIKSIVESAPKTANSVEGGIKVALAKAGDVDEFVKVLIDVLNGPSGEHNAAACQAFIRSFAAENAGRVKASKPEKAPTKTVAERNAEKRAASADGTKTKATPVKAKAAPVKADATPDAEPIDPATDEDMWDDVDDAVEPEVAVEAPVAPVKKAAPVARKKAAPVVRKA